MIACTYIHTIKKPKRKINKKDVVILIVGFVISLFFADFLIVKIMGISYEQASIYVMIMYAVTTLILLTIKVIRGLARFLYEKLLEEGEYRSI